jgi:hypothetical protein
VHAIFYSEGPKSIYRLQQVVMGDCNTPLSPTDRSSKQKNNKEILELNHTIDQMDLDDVYRIFHPTLHNIHSSKQPMEPSPKFIISKDTKQASENIRK